MKTTPLLTPTVSTAAGDQGTTSQKMDAPAGSGFTEHLQEASKALEADSDAPESNTEGRGPRDGTPTSPTPVAVSHPQGPWPAEGSPPVPLEPGSDAPSSATGPAVGTRLEPPAQQPATPLSWDAIQGEEPVGDRLPSLDIQNAPRAATPIRPGVEPDAHPTASPTTEGTFGSLAKAGIVPQAELEPAAPSGAGEKPLEPLERPRLPSAAGTSSSTLADTKETLTPPRPSAAASGPPPGPSEPSLAHGTEEGAFQNPSLDEPATLEKALLEKAAAPDKGSDTPAVERARPDLAQGAGRSPSLQSSATTSAPTTQAAPPMEGRLDPPVGHQAWAKSLANQALVLADREGHRARLRLNPEHLGSLDVQLTLKENEARIHFGSHQAPVREALEQALPRLRDAFNAAGMELVEVDISRHGLGDGGQGRPQGEPTGQEPWEAPDEHPILAEGPVSALPMGLIDYYI